jgi:hypothetical protein
MRTLRQNIIRQINSMRIRWGNVYLTCETGECVQNFGSEL